MSITKESALFEITRLFNIAEKSQTPLYKQAFTPMYPGGSTPPQDPAAAGAPPMDPAMMDPAAAGMDPAAAGTDPAMMQQMQEMMAQQGGAPMSPTPPPAAPTAAPRGEEAAANGAFTGEEEKLSTDDKLDILMENQNQLLQMVQAIGDMLSAMLSPEDPAAVEGAPPMAPPMDPAMAGGAPSPEMMAPPMDPAMAPEMMAPPAPEKMASSKNDLLSNIMTLLSRDN